MSRVFGLEKFLRPCNLHILQSGPAICVEFRSFPQSSKMDLHEIPHLHAIPANWIARKCFLFSTIIQINHFCVEMDLHEFAHFRATPANSFARKWVISRSVAVYVCATSYSTLILIIWLTLWHAKRVPLPWEFPVQVISQSEHSFY